jgi:hypothetical protein
MWPPPKKEPAPAPAQKAPPPRPATGPQPAAAAEGAVKRKRRPALTAFGLAVLAVALIAFGRVAPSAFLSHLTVFSLACVVGWQVIWNVTPALHTPLMSVTNAISGIIVVGGMLQVSGPILLSSHHPRRQRHLAGVDQHRGRVPGHAADAADVSQVAHQTQVKNRCFHKVSSTLAYITAGLLFIFSLSGLSAQESAGRGNVLGMVGMAIAVIATRSARTSATTPSSWSRSRSRRWSAPPWPPGWR